MQNEGVYVKMEHAANNALLLMVARVSMALALPVLAGISTVGGMYLDQKFSVQDAKIEEYKRIGENETRIHAAQIQRIESAANTAVVNASKVGERLIGVETKQNQESIASSQFQQATLTRLDRMQESIISLSNSIASLTATLQAQESHRRRVSPNERD